MDADRLKPVAATTTAVQMMASSVRNVRRPMTKLYTPLSLVDDPEAPEYPGIRQLVEWIRVHDPLIAPEQLNRAIDSNKPDPRFDAAAGLSAPVGQLRIDAERISKRAPVQARIPVDRVTNRDVQVGDPR